MSEKKPPQTKKSRTVAQLSDALVTLVNDGLYDPTKANIVDAVVRDQLSASADKVFIDMMSSETSNMLETYFADVCKAASDDLGLPYHYTSKLWYRKTAVMPKSEEEARQFVVVFGNGRTGKAAGVRFVTPDDEPDPMLLVALNKQIDVINAAIKTHSDKISRVIMTESVGLEDRGRFQKRLPDSSALLGNPQ